MNNIRKTCDMDIASEQVSTEGQTVKAEIVWSSKTSG